MFCAANFTFYIQLNLFRHQCVVNILFYLICLKYLMDKWNQGIIGRVAARRKTDKHKVKRDQKKRSLQVLIKRSRLVEELIKKQFVHHKSREHLTHTKDSVDTSSLPKLQKIKCKSSDVVKKPASLVDIPFLPKLQLHKHRRRAVVPKPKNSVDNSYLAVPEIKHNSPEQISKPENLVDISSSAKEQPTKPTSPEIILKPQSLVDISSPGEPQTTKPKSPEIISKPPSLVDISSPVEPQSTMTGRRNENHEEIKRFIVVCGKDRHKVIEKPSTLKLGETIVERECTSRNKEISECDSLEVDEQRCGAAESFEEMIHKNISPEKKLASAKTREIRKISLTSPNTANKSDVPFSLPVIKITIGGTNGGDIRKANIQSPAKVDVSDQSSDQLLHKSPAAKPTRTKKWKRTSIENVFRITTNTPIFSSVVLGTNILEKPCTLKKIKLGPEWKKSLLSPDRPDLCSTPATASSGYTSECESTKTPPALSDNSAYSFKNVPESVPAATSISPRKNKSPIAFPPPICISVPNNIEPSKLCLDSANAKRQVDFEQNSWSAKNSPQRRVMFKMPQLPNTKRPPSRIKSFSHMTENVSERVEQPHRVKSSSHMMENALERVDQPHPQQDDVISIFAGSEILDDDHTNLHYQPTVRSPNPFDDGNMTFPDFECEGDGALPVQEPVEPYRPENPVINDWIASTRTHGQWNLKRTLDSVCRFYKQSGHCHRFICNFSHTIPAIYNNLESLSVTDFLMVLRFTVTSKMLFKSTFDLLLNYMSNHGRHDLILNFVPDILKMGCDKMPYIKKVISKLKKLGFTFEEALSEMLTITGGSNECLLDILLSFAVDEDCCIVDHWNLIQKLISSRKDRLDKGVVSDIFKKCIELNPPNKNLCENIYKDLCVNSYFDLKAVDKIVILKYIALLLHFHLDPYAIYILQNHGIRMEEVQQYLLPKSEKTTKEVPALTSVSEPTNIQSTAERMEDKGEGEMVEGVEPESCENGFVDYRPDACDHYNPQLDWNEYDLMEEERVQRESFRQTPIARTSSFGSSRSSSVPYFAPYQPIKVHSSTQPGGNSFGTPTNWVFNNQSHSEIITAGPSHMTPSCLEVASTTPVRTTPVRTTPVKKIELEDEDIILLVDAIKMQDISRIFVLMQQFYEPYKTMKSFVVHIIAALKKMPSIENACTVIQNMYKRLGEDFKYMNDKKMVDMLRLLGFNLLPRLDEERCYGTACQIIDMFSKDFNAFTTVECFSKYDFLSTKELKYIFFFKIFTRNLRYKDAIRLLKQPELKLLDCLFSNTTEKMNDYKRRLVNEFFESSLKHSTSDAKDGIVFFMLNSRVEPSDEMTKYLNILIAKMLNGYDSYKEDIINLYDNIVNSWYMFMKKTILRAYFIVTFYDLPDAKILEFFNLCVDLSVYPGHKGTENSIMLPSNLVEEEIYLIIHSHLYKIIQSKFPVNNLVIKADDYLPKDEYTDLMVVMAKSEVSYPEMIRRILLVLNKLRNFPLIQRLDIQDRYIILPFHELNEFLQPYSWDKLPPLSKIR